MIPQPHAAAAAIPPGFDDPALDSQAVFRAILQAMSRPGLVCEIGLPTSPPAPLNDATASVALALFDLSTPLWVSPDLASPAMAEHLRFHTGCPLTERAANAAFAIIDGDQAADLDGFAVGTPEYPDKSTTVIVQVGGLAPDGGVRLSGPGIEDVHAIAVDGIHLDFWRERAKVNAAFPLGLDFVLTCGERLAALPRTTKAEV